MISINSLPNDNHETHKKEWTIHAKIIAALMRKMGKTSVTLELEDLIPPKGMAITETLFKNWVIEIQEHDDVADRET